MFSNKRRDPPLHMIWGACGTAIVVILLLLYIIYKKSNDAQKMIAEMKLMSEKLKKRTLRIKEMNQKFAESLKIKVESKIADIASQLNEKIENKYSQIDMLTQKVEKITQELRESKSKRKDEKVLTGMSIVNEVKSLKEGLEDVGNLLIDNAKEISEPFQKPDVKLTNNSPDKVLPEDSGNNSETSPFKSTGKEIDPKPTEIWNIERNTNTLDQDDKHQSIKDVSQHPSRLSSVTKKESQVSISKGNITEGTVPVSPTINREEVSKKELSEDMAMTNSQDMAAQKEKRAKVLPEKTVATSKLDGVISAVSQKDDQVKRAEETPDND